MTTYKVEVEFIAQVEQLKSQLAQAMGQIKGTDTAATSAAAVLGRMGEAGATAGKEIVKGAGQAEGAMKGLSGATTVATGDMGSALTGLLGKLGLVAAGWKALKAVFGFGEMGIEFNAAMETAQLGIASLIAAQSKLVDAKGEELKGQEALNAAMAISADQLQKLKIAGLETVATTQQLVVAYQQAVGVGLSLGMNLDEIRQITVKIVQAASALGVPMNQLAEEVRDLLQGNINPRNTRIATALGITNEEVRKWQAAGGHTLADELNKRMEAFGVAGDKAAQTWSGVTSNVVEATQTLAGAISQPLFEKIRDGLQNALRDAFDLKNARISESFSGLVEAGQEASSAIGDLFQGALAWVVESAKELSAWFKENRKDVIEMVGAAKALAMQIGGVIKDLVSVGAAANQAQGQFSVLKTIVEGIGLVIAVIRDVVSVLAFGIQTVGVFLLQGVLGPIQLVLIGIGEAMNFVKQGSGEAVVKVAADMQKFLDAGHAGADAFLKPLLEGKGAVAQFGDALLEARMKAQALEEANKKAADSLAGVSGNPKAPGATDQSGIISALEIEARLASIRASFEEKITLEQQKQAALKKAEAEYLHEAARIQKEAREGKFDGNQAGVDALWAANLERRKEREAAIDREFAKKRQDMEADLQARLTAGEEGGLQKRLEAVRKASEKMLQEARALRTADTTDADMAAKEEAIRQAERAATERARQDQVRADLSRLKQELAELAQMKGHALSFQEQEEVLARFTARSNEAAQAVAMLREELHLNGTATQGWLAGIQDWISQASNSFQIYRQIAVQTLNSVGNSFTQTLAGMLSGQIKLGNAWKTLWQGIRNSASQAIAEVITAKLKEWVVDKAISAWRHADAQQSIAEGGEETAANTTSAASGIFKAHSGIPWVGVAMAIAMVALMMATMSSITARAVGGLVTKPELTLMGEAGPEVIAPEASFADYTARIFSMGANLQSNLLRNDRIVQDYAVQGAGFAQGAVDAQSSAYLGQSSRNGRQGDTIVHLNGPIMDTSDRGLENLGHLVKRGLQVAASRQGQVMDTSQMFGARI